MYAKKRIKIAVTGAAGQVAYSFLFRLLTEKIFPGDVILDLHLLDLSAALPKVRGVAMELQDCAVPELGNVVCTDNADVAMDGVSWAILIGASPRKAGMERGDLLRANAEIFKVQARALNDHAASNVRVLVVGNPCNTNCLIAMHNAPKIPRENFYAMTLLDEQRARAQLAAFAHVEISAVKNTIVWGNHSATQFPDFYHAQIAGRAACEAVDESWCQTDFLHAVRERGAAVIKARGVSSGASAAHGILETLRRLENGRASDQAFSLAIASRGEYGIDEGLVFSYPCQIVDGKVQVVNGVVHNNFAQEQINLTLAELRVEMEMVKKAGFL